MHLLAPKQMFEALLTKVKRSIAAESTAKEKRAFAFTDKENRLILAV